jgi:predicted glycosyltransferase involved in capsule biosynthesis
MKQQIVIPWRDSGCEYRLRSFNFLYEYYSQKYEIVIGDKNDVNGNFSRSGSRNDGVSKIDSDIAVVIDSDNYISYDQIDDAIDTAKANNVLVKPNHKFAYVDKPSTEKFYKDKIDFKNLTFQGRPANFFPGGAYVIKKRLWDLVGGMDEKFIGYGAEDNAFHIICEKELGKTKWIKGCNYHLYHPSYRHTPKENLDRLRDIYKKGLK